MTDFAMRIRCRSKIRLACARALLLTGARLFHGTRYDIEIKDGRRWVPIVKAERLMEAR